MSRILRSCKLQVEAVSLLQTALFVLILCSALEPARAADRSDVFPSPSLESPEFPDSPQQECKWLYAGCATPAPMSASASVGTGGRSGSAQDAKESDGLQGVDRWVSLWARAQHLHVNYSASSENVLQPASEAPLCEGYLLSSTPPLLALPTHHCFQRSKTYIHKFIN